MRAKGEGLGFGSSSNPNPNPNPNPKQDNKLTALPNSLGANKLLERVNLSGNKIVGCEAVIENLQRVCTAADGMYWPPS